MVQVEILIDLLVLICSTYFLLRQVKAKREPDCRLALAVDFTSGNNDFFLI